MTPEEKLREFGRQLRLSRTDIETLLGLQLDAVLKERERIRLLAEALDAYYTVTTAIPGGGWDVQERKFAEVITEGRKS